MLFQKKPSIIRFRCREEDEGVIAPPVPARTFLPGWFRKLPAIDPDQLPTADTGLTVKRCLPFLDAMTTGWVIPLAATVRLEIGENGSKVDAGWEFDRAMVSHHGAHQVRGQDLGDRPPCKFHNYWTIETPPGWSCLFVHPLNRPNGVFEIVSGVVDTDTYVSEIHFPFFATGDDGLHVLEQGSPLVQIIPFCRDTTELEAEIRAEEPHEAAHREAILRKTQAATGWYREKARARR